MADADGTLAPLKGDFALCHYRVAGDPAFDVPDVGMVAVTSPDAKHLFAIAWPDCRRVLTNAGIPCVHADLPAYTAPPRKRLHVRDKVFLMEGTLDDLLKRYQREVLPLARPAK